MVLSWKKPSNHVTSKLISSFIHPINIHYNIGGIKYHRHPYIDMRSSAIVQLESWSPSYTLWCHQTWLAGKSKNPRTDAWSFSSLGTSPISMVHLCQANSAKHVGWPKDSSRSSRFNTHFFPDARQTSVWLRSGSESRRGVPWDTGLIWASIWERSRQQHISAHQVGGTWFIGVLKAPKW